MVNWNDVGADTGRFTLHEDGQITWQGNKTNPLPGDHVGTIQKGQGQLTPDVKIIESASLDDSLKSTLQAKIESWVQLHLREVLAPLFALMDENEHALQGAAKGIGFQLYENMGVIHRSEIESLVPDLTPELRGPIRKKRIKMGPILVFMPDLVKPAAINLRAMLWGLWHERALPMQRPADGRVSLKIEGEPIDRNFYRSIGYPIFGPMAIRIDMLDRVVTDIYDSSKEFKFQAQHKYMEWLGCGEDDLYSILGAMGFRKLNADVPPAVKPDEVSVTPSSDLTGASAGEKTDEDSLAKPKDDVVNEVKSQEKPVLATFLLKKGKISDRPAPKPHRNHENKPKFNKKDKKTTKPKVNSYSSKPKATEIDENSPFAILKQLKK